MIKPFKVNVSEDILKEINNKVINYPWHEMPKDGGWNYGTNLEYMKEISNYWVTKFNWKKHEEEINKFSNFKTDVDGIEMHFIYSASSPCCEQQRRRERPSSIERALLHAR